MVSVPGSSDEQHGNEKEGEKKEDHVPHHSHERESLYEAECSGRGTPVEEEVGVVYSAAEIPFEGVSDRCEEEVIQRWNDAPPCVTSIEGVRFAAKDVVRNGCDWRYHMYEDAAERVGRRTVDRCKHEVENESGEEDGNREHHVDHRCRVTRLPVPEHADEPRQTYYAYPYVGLRREEQESVVVGASRTVGNQAENHSCEGADDYYEFEDQGCSILHKTIYYGWNITSVPATAPTHPSPFSTLE